MKSNRRFVHIIADYGLGDPAFGEVTQRIKRYYPEADLFTTSVPAFDTLATGFWIYQYGMGISPDNMFIYSNTAPRKDDKRARKDNAGEKFVFARLENGVELMAVNAGYCLSFVKPHIENLTLVNVPNEGSQFRSRDYYPKVAADHLVDKDVLDDALDVALIPDLPGGRIAWMDGYGNIKTTIRASELDLHAGEKIKVSINGITRTALVAGGNFSVSEGELSFSPGSSGFDDPFYELFLRGGSARELFNTPRHGAKVKIV